MKTQLLVLSVVLASGCMSPVDTLGTVQDAVIEARGAFQPAIDGICHEMAVACKGERNVSFAQDELSRSACDDFEVCDGFRMQVIFTFEKINMLIADANLSLAIGDAQGADEIITKALTLIEQLRTQMRALGYLK